MHNDLANSNKTKRGKKTLVEREKSVLLWFWMFRSNHTGKQN